MSRSERVAQADRESDRVILVIEDDPATRSIETIVLEDGGFTVVQANTGEVGIRLAREHRPGVILLDLALPRMSGFDVLNSLKSASSTAHIPVVVLSSYASLVENCAERGASGWLQKPFSRDELLSQVRRLLRPRVAPTPVVRLAPRSR
jgi:two-component system cell cycle response regulator DivK